MKRLIKLSGAQREIAADTPQEITAKAKQALGPAPMRLQWNRLLLVLPESSEHGPAESQRKQRYQLAEALSVAEMGRFKVEASTFQRGEERLNAPSQAVIG